MCTVENCANQRQNLLTETPMLLHEKGVRSIVISIETVVNIQSKNYFHENGKQLPVQYWLRNGEEGYIHSGKFWKVKENNDLRLGFLEFSMLVMWALNNVFGTCRLVLMLYTHFGLYRRMLWQIILFFIGKVKCQRRLAFSRLWQTVTASKSEALLCDLRTIM